MGAPYVKIVGGERIFWTQVLSTETFLGRPQKKRNNSELADAQDFKFRGVEDSLVETWDPTSSIPKKNPLKFDVTINLKKEDV